MEGQDIIVTILGVVISVLGWFIRREVLRVETKILQLKDQVRELQIEWQINDTRDIERWRWIDKNMEDRRQDIRKLFDGIHELTKTKQDK